MVEKIEEILAELNAIDNSEDLALSRIKARAKRLKTELVRFTSN